MLHNSAFKKDGSFVNWADEDALPQLNALTKTDC